MPSPVRPCTRCGQARAHSRGLCHGCYRRAWRHNELPPKTEAARPVRSCSRCGLPIGDEGSGCLDCTVVLRDLGEIEQWAERSAS